MEQMYPEASQTKTMAVSKHSVDNDEGAHVYGLSIWPVAPSIKVE